MSFKQLGVSMFGIPTFGKAPQVQPDGKWKADVAILGVPFDQGTGFRSGTRHGPKHIRDWSIRYTSLSAERPGYHDMRTNSWRAECKIVDCADVEILPLVWEDNFKRTTDAVKAILKNKAMPVVLGGDHSITFPVVKAYEDQKKKITVVQFDAHADYRDEVYGVRYGHGNVLRRVRELPFVEKIVSIGINSFRQQPKDLQDHKKAGNTMICAWEVHEKGVDHFTKLLPKGKDVYITFDIDALDASIVPGTGTPEPGGLTFIQARKFLDFICSKNKIVGFDLMEVNPLYDPSFITALTATHVIIESLGTIYPGKK